MSILLSDFKSIIRGLPPRPRVGDSKAEEEKEFLFDSETRLKIVGTFTKQRGEIYYKGKEREIYLSSNIRAIN